VPMSVEIRALWRALLGFLAATGPRRDCPGVVSVLSIAVTAFAAALVLATPRAGAAPGLGTIDVESTDATAHDRLLFEGVARELERHHDLWTSSPPRGTKTFRVKTHARGSVLGLTEQRSSVDHVAACKLLRHRLWRLKLRSTAPRTVVVTFRFRPRSP
jgi:hypothetical protein